MQVSLQLEINYVLSALITASAFSSHPPETHNLTHLGLPFASPAPSLKSPLPALSGFHRYEVLSIHENSVSTEVPICEEPPLTPGGEWSLLPFTAPLLHTAPEGIPCLSLSWQRREDGGQVFLVWTPAHSRERIQIPLGIQSMLAEGMHESQWLGVWVKAQMDR